MVLYCHLPQILAQLGEVDIFLQNFIKYGGRIYRETIKKLPDLEMLTQNIISSMSEMEI